MRTRLWSKISIKIFWPKIDLLLVVDILWPHRLFVDCVGLLLILWQMFIPCWELEQPRTLVTGWLSQICLGVCPFRNSRARNHNWLATFFAVFITFRRPFCCMAMPHCKTAVPGLGVRLIFSMARQLDSSVRYVRTNTNIEFSDQGLPSA